MHGCDYPCVFVRAGSGEGGAGAEGGPVANCERAAECLHAGAHLRVGDANRRGRALISFVRLLNAEAVVGAAVFSHS